MPEDQFFELLLKQLGRMEDKLENQGRELAELRVTFADLGVGRRLKSLEEFKRVWEPQLWKAVGILAVLSIGGAWLINYLAR